MLVVRGLQPAPPAFRAGHEGPRGVRRDVAGSTADRADSGYGVNNAPTPPGEDGAAARSRSARPTAFAPRDLTAGETTVAAGTTNSLSHAVDQQPGSGQRPSCHSRGRGTRTSRRPHPRMTTGTLTRSEEH